MSVIDFPKRAQSVADQLDAMNHIRATLDKFTPSDRLVILAGSLGSALCEMGEKPGRAYAIAGLGLAFEAALDMVNRTYGDRDGTFQ